MAQPDAQVGVDSFGLGILVGVFGTISTIAAVLQGHPGAPCCRDPQNEWFILNKCENKMDMIG